MFRIKASLKQLQKLRNGHPTRVSPAVEGEGFNLIVHPDRYNHILKTFSKGKGSVISLSPEELQANRTVQGSGIFSSLKKAGKAVMKSPVAKALAKQAVDYGVKTANESGYVPAGLADMAGDYAKSQIGSGIYGGAGFFDSVKKAGKAVMKSPVAKALAKQAVDYGVKTASSSGYVSPEIANMLGSEVHKAIGSGVFSSLKKMGKKVMAHPMAKDIMHQAVSMGVDKAVQSGYVPAGVADMLGAEVHKAIGTGMFDSLKKVVKSVAKSPVAKSLAKQAVDYGVKTAKSSGYVPAGLADMAGDYAKGQIGSGIYAGASRGGGVSGRGSLLNVNNSHLPPAMQSQNASSNFNFHTQLPPALASIKGSGIYM